MAENRRRDGKLLLLYRNLDSGRPFVHAGVAHSRLGAWRMWRAYALSRALDASYNEDLLRTRRNHKTTT